MKIVNEVPTDVNITPEKLQSVQAQLKKLGYNNIGEVAKDMSKSFKDLAVHNKITNLKPIYKS